MTVAKKTTPKAKEDDKIKVVVLRKLAVADPDHRMVLPGEEIEVERSVARKFQEVGAVKVVI